MTQMSVNNTHVNVSGKVFITSHNLVKFPLFALVSLLLHLLFGVSHVLLMWVGADFSLFMQS